MPKLLWSEVDLDDSVEIHHKPVKQKPTMKVKLRCSFCDAALASEVGKCPSCGADNRKNKSYINQKES